MAMLNPVIVQEASRVANYNHKKLAENAQLLNQAQTTRPGIIEQGMDKLHDLLAVAGKGQVAGDAQAMGRVRS